MPSSILNSDDGVISGTSGIKTTGGDDGVLVFQSKGTETARINTDKQIVAAAGTASLPALTTTGDVNTGIFFPAADTIAFAEGGAEAMRIDSSGNVGVGNSNPSGGVSASLTGMVVGGSQTGTQFKLFTSNTGTTASDGALFSLDSSSNAYLWNYENAPLIFGTNNTERARITSGGAFCINRTSGSGKLNIEGDVYLFDQSSGAGTSTLKYNHSVTGLVTFDTSSRLVKENIEDSPYGLNEVLQLQPRKYFRTDDQQNEIGLVADEVVDVLPELVPIGQKSALTQNPEDVELIPLGVNYDKLTAVLVKAIQELKTELDEAKARIAALEQA